MVKYSAIIAAAGLSSRMKNFKPLMPLGDMPMVEVLIDRYQDAGIDDITLVTGYKGDLLKNVLSHKDIRIVENKDYATNKMLDSVIMGLKGRVYGAEKGQASEGGEPNLTFITPVDIPLTSGDTLNKMKKAKGDIIVPTYLGQPGHFFALSASASKKLMSYDGNRGLRGFLRANSDEISYVETEDPGVILTADTPKELQELRRANNAIRGGGNLFPEIELTLTKADAVFTNQNIMLLEMIEKTGSLSAACDVMHMSYTKGWTMLNIMEEELGRELVYRHSGGSDGGGSRLTTDGKKFVSMFNTFLDRMKRHAREEFEEIFEGENR